MIIKSSGILFLFILLLTSVYANAGEADESYTSCRDDTVVTEVDTNPECNLLSFPAREIDDPYVFAASYFNYKMNIILRENVVSEFAYLDVPYYIYKSFMNADSKETYWENCIKDKYNRELIY